MIVSKLLNPTKAITLQRPLCHFPRVAGQSKEWVRNLHLTRAKNYTVTYGFPLGLLINFGDKILEHKLLLNHHQNQDLKD
jgi:hypothetical protein